jgi:lipoyl(octanoyl) transferase
LNIENWGLISYAEASARQLALVENLIEDTLVFCTHPPVVTAGRGTKPSDIFSWTGEVHESSRGGRATYHGPNQMVAYPILNLAESNRKKIAARDLHSYMRALEGAVVDTLKEFGIISEAKSMKPDYDSPSLTGVWVQDKKIASIGIAVKKWISYHGLALNVDHDPSAFSGIHPCGFQSHIMTSVEEVLGEKLERTRLQKVLQAVLIDYLRMN